MNHWVKPLLSLLLAAECPLCQRSSSRVFCLDCERQIKRCQLPQRQPQSNGLPIFAWGEYGGTLKRAIAALKYSAKPEIARPLGQWMGSAWLQAAPALPRSTVIPIPLHADKQQQRGYNQADLLAAAFCQVTRLPIAPHGLKRVRATEAQFGLSKSDRQQNLAEAFAVAPSFDRRSVLLLDDIYTTGATVEAAAACLRQRGIQVAGVVALSRPAQTGR